MKLLGASLFLWLACSVAADPIVIAHRGASGYFPEHTLAAYDAAIRMDADFIEPDLVLTKDGHFVALHDIFLSETTDIADVFPNRSRTIDDRHDWFVSDFTLEEIRKLRTRQRFPDRGLELDDRLPVPTLEEIIRLVGSAPRPVGIYPELKAPGHFRAKGFDMGTMLLEVLGQYQISGGVLIQSFDQELLESLHGKTDFPLVMLLYPLSAEQASTSNLPLSQVAKFADGVGLSKYLLLNAPGADIIQDARSLGLFVHLWTVRDDQVRAGFESVEGEITAYLQLGIDGIFTDFPDTAVRVRNRYIATATARPQ